MGQWVLAALGGEVAEDEHGGPRARFPEHALARDAAQCLRAERAGRDEPPGEGVDAAEAE